MAIKGGVHRLRSLSRSGNKFLTALLYIYYYDVSHINPKIVVYTYVLLKRSTQEDKVILRFFLPVLVFLLVILQVQCSIPEVDDIDPPVVTILYPYS